MDCVDVREQAHWGKNGFGSREPRRDHAEENEMVGKKSVCAHETEDEMGGKRSNPSRCINEEPNTWHN